jgi:hypothetical protein
LERQSRNQRIPEHGLEVEQVADKLVHLVVIVLVAHLEVVGRTIGVGEQLLEPGTHHSGDRIQAPHARAGRSGLRRTGHEDTLDN